MPNNITVTEHLWIPLADGSRLAARLWLPDSTTKVPAILEYIPYRKRDGTRARDEPMHGWFATQGYAAIRVDLRGSGESDGFLDDEYLPREQDDALEVIAWIAAQPWCSGAVGMMGKSWGGFNALQVAARRPPALRAIITLCSTDDRYADDIHYMGGCLLNDNLWWGAIMLAYQGRPPDPQLVGEDWRQIWLARLQHMPLWPALWMQHQRRGAYWQQGSVCEDWGAIACPVLAIGGWADAYTSAVFRLLANLTVPRQGIVGPWAHLYPQDGVPGPAIGFLQEAKRWWDHWLKGEANDVMAEPMLRAYIQTEAASEQAGRWVAESVWPRPDPPGTLFLTEAGLIHAPGPAATRRIKSPLWTGLCAGAWMGTGVAGEAPFDQRLDDANSAVFDTAPLTKDLDILGVAVVELPVSADAPSAQLAVRLCEVTPDGSSVRVSYGVHNLAEAQPGLRLTLKACGHRFAAGNRIRLAISSAYWPLLWPAAHPATLTLGLGASRLELPVRHGADGGVTFPPPEHGAAAPVTKLADGVLTRAVSLDLISNTATYVIKGEGGVFGEGVLRFDEIGTALDHGLTQTLTVQGDDPASAKAEIVQHYAMARDGWQIRLDTTLSLTADAEAFHLVATLRASENGMPVASRDWNETIRRDGV